ncbi:tRNA (adenosine(37)-N6)-threonylcarbamoyltransferase complex dimerization subunit type 1 TsaB [Aquabacterium sp.]|uniref:tRNA (adenosine(37)-N6)-threonylcarbamoyltransferase complex dimerization subunit type 1 TsaB n=1 Tax=Aquabacterium sp. TaxID=1872578 RepID=UPI0025C1EA66|nr:tRNA (adenosine(37)-N6)-threonylcarbamoyltransferase complex dimerization subunit type 1 TsaB [Aquabacterium sp.]
MSDSVFPTPLAAPILLALDTATERLHIALVAGDAVHTRDLPGGAQASAALLPASQALLAAAGLRWADVDAIAFGSGPGAFTGLRTACAVTQGLALGLDCPAIVLDTLMAVAEDARQRACAADPQACPPGQTLWVLQDARMDELYAAAFAWDGQAWQATEGPALWPLSEPLRRWAEAAPGNVRLCGNALLQCAQALAGLPEALCLPGGAQAVPSGAALAALAAQAWRAGRSVDAALALPRYVRDKVAQTTAERAAAAQA